MKTILRIEHKDYLLPASANVNLLLKVLGEMKCLRRQYTHPEKYTVSDSPEIEVLVIKDAQIIDPKKCKRLTENAGPDAHNRNHKP